MEKYSYRRAWSKVRNTNLKIGFLCSLSFVFFAFQLTVSPSKVKVLDNTQLWPEEDVYKTPILPKPPVFIPPVPIDKSMNEKQIIEDFIIDEQPVINEDSTEKVKFIEDFFQSVDTNSTVIIAPKIVAPKVSQVEIEDEGPPAIHVEQMPVFGECSDHFTEAERRMCSDKAILNYISKNLKYPTMAREIGLEGKVVAKFVIDKTGEVTNIEILRDLGAGTGEEVLKVLEKMPDWKPGKQNYRPVKVQIIVPVKFQLN